MEGLAPQAFASNNLDRSMTERREQAFLRTIFHHSLMLIVSDGKVLVTKGPNTHLRWFRPFELQNLAYEMEDRGLHREAGTPLPAISWFCTPCRNVICPSCTSRKSKAICMLLNRDASHD